jgi:hypothetical protein
VKRTSRITRRSSRSSTESPKPSRATRVPRRAFVERDAADALLAIDDTLRALGLGWYLFGAQAVAAYGVPRTTTDIDVTVDLGAASTAALANALVANGFALRSTDAAFTEANRVLLVRHLASGWSVDVIIAGPGLEAVFLERAIATRLGRRTIPVIAPDDLVALKVLAHRRKDQDDVIGILRNYPALDRARLRETVALLEEALDQRDLLPLLDQLEREAKRR